MAKKLIADLMVDYLERRNVKYVFGLCGHTVIGMLDALSRSKKVKYISNRHEAVASTAADGYARFCRPLPSWTGADECFDRCSKRRI